MVKDLMLGTEVSAPNRDEKLRRVAELEEAIEKYIPEFIGKVAELAKGDDDEPLVIHQDAFAAAYDEDEYTLLGMAIKYAGLKGVGLSIIGLNGETLTGELASNIAGFPNSS